jgi:hypothetical protein
MNTEIQLPLVNRAQAKKLQKLGFDWETFEYYNINEYYNVDGHSNYYNDYLSWTIGRITEHYSTF